MGRSDNNICIIWKSFQSGEKEAFACLYNMYVESLFRYGTKICKDESLVKDAIQDVFIDLYLKRKSNKTNPENLKYYLILALKRNLIKKIKRKSRLVEETTDELMFEPEYSIEKILIEKEEETELNRNVHKILKELPSKQKEALYLRFNESMPYSEIAKVMDISIESVRKQVYRALKTLRAMFDKRTFLFWIIFNRYK
jgi:RNA polymerase sigma factor (sigma-70 family)